MVTECRTADGERVAYQYDTEDQLTAVVNPLGQAWRLQRDALGRVTEERDYWGQATGYRWMRAAACCSAPMRWGDADVRLRPGGTAAGKTQRRHAADALPLCGGRAADAVREPLAAAGMALRRGGRLLAESQDGFTLRHHYNDAGQRILRESDGGHRVAFSWSTTGSWRR
ncbi:YD repeat (two copies) [Serratia rubidaea]|uniref:YD repeat (Two copies) n=1 Tax=Serratia rubidaea TaxID=61652 RepID=A0A447QJU6_SERRU|nr:YD repeat (two copies) [Serratia rubidaea]